MLHAVIARLLPPTPALSSHCGQSRSFGSTPYLQASDYQTPANVTIFPAPCVSLPRMPCAGDAPMIRSVSARGQLQSPDQRCVYPACCTCRYSWVGTTLVMPINGTAALGLLSTQAPNQFRVTVDPPQFSNFNGACVQLSANAHVPSTSNRNANVL